MDIDILRTLKFLPGIILGLTVHEFSHAFMSNRCGDNTALEQGRLTLNPLKHIDIMGFIMLLLVGFGWAKPVQFNEQNLRNPKRDIMKIAAAGPFSNAIIAMLLSIIFALLYDSLYRDNVFVIYEIFLYAIFINWGLFIFNMIPIPPLDGSHLLLTLFRRYPVIHERLYRYGSYALIVLILGSIIFKIDLLPIWPLIEFFAKGFFHLLGVQI